ncbi:MAG: 30S ribosomal protein S9 [Spirochaetes bacterium]|nr:30S ribosomal protein S9 [Spirochaetota bacterium]
MGLSKKIGETIFATGRRKTAIARVMLKKGSGKIIINNKEISEYFPAGNFEMIIRQPIEVTGVTDDYDFNIKVYGGGLTGQAGAIRHGIARAIDFADDSNHKALKTNKFLTRDPRMVERKKYGQKKARKRFQFSKR